MMSDTMFCESADPGWAFYDFGGNGFVIVVSSGWILMISDKMFCDCGHFGWDFDDFG